MTKLIDLSHRKEATDLLVDCANMAVWYGFPNASRLIIDWMKHRSDGAAPVMWIDALRSMRFENFEDAKAMLRAMIEHNPADNHAKSLLAHILVETGEVARNTTVSELVEDPAIGASAKVSLNHSQLKSVKPNSTHQTPAFGAVIG